VANIKISLNLLIAKKEIFMNLIRNLLLMSADFQDFTYHEKISITVKPVQRDTSIGRTPVYLLLVFQLVLLVLGRFNIYILIHTK